MLSGLTNEEFNQIFVLPGKAIFAHCDGSPTACLVKLDWLMTVTTSPLVSFSMTSPLRPARPAHIQIADGDFGGSGKSATVGSFSATRFGAATVFLCLTGSGFLTGSTTGAVTAGAAVSVGGVLNGAGMGGSEFVCATALAAIITPKINQ